MITDVDAVLLDTNVLLSATVPERKLHSAALEVLNDWPNRGIRLCLSGQVVREYLVVATRALAENGLGLSVSDALDNVAAFVRRSLFLSEGPEVSDRLRELLQVTACAGKQIHDANLVATALAHEVPGLVTANIVDFHRFRETIEIVPLG